MLPISRAATVRLLSLLSLFASSGAVEAASGLSFLQSLSDGVGNIDKLKGVSAVAVSPDGGNVYAAGTTDDAIVVFSRSVQTGLLSFIEEQVDNTGPIDGLDSVRAVAVSPDGAQVYTAASRDDAVTIFRRDASTGALTFVERIRDAVDGVDGLDGAVALAFSPDATNLYVAGNVDNAIAVFSRNSSNGALTFVPPVPGDGTFGTSGLRPIRDVTLSPDGAYLYAAGGKSVFTFQRNATTGALTLLTSLSDSDPGADGLEGVAALLVSPDGKHLYSAGKGESALGVFARDATSGGLTFVEVVRDLFDGVEGLSSVQGLAMAPNGAQLYAASGDGSAVTVFARDANDGTLTFAGAHMSEVGDSTGLGGAKGLSLSPDGANLYVAATDDRAVTVFSTHCADGTLDPDEQCDDGNNARGDGCSPGCRIECSSATSCDDADTCTEEHCRGGECSNPRCGFDGSLCELADSVPALEDEPTCAPVPPKLRRAIVRRINRAGRKIQNARRGNPDLTKLVQRVSTDIDAIAMRAIRLEKNHRIPVECRDAVARSIAALSDSLADMLLHRQSCAP